MPDQAHGLRNLMQRFALSSRRDLHTQPRVVVLTGAKGGVGTTSIAVNVAAALSTHGHRTVLVDADLTGANIALQCGIDAEHSIGDILTGARSIHEILQTGPGGMLVVPGAWAPDHEAELTENHHQRMIHQVQSLGRHADYVVVDSGSGCSQVAASFWSASDVAIVVTTTDAIAIMDAYATIKLLHKRQPDAHVALLINQAPNAAAAEEVFQRIDHSCRRFLALQPEYLGHVGACSQLALGSQCGMPVSLQSPHSAAAQAVDRIVDRLSPAASTAAA